MPRTVCSNLVANGSSIFDAQAAHRHLDDVRVRVEVHVPDLFGDRGSRQHLAAASQQQCQESELLRRQVEPLFATMRPATDEIDLQVGKLQRVDPAEAADPRRSSAPTRASSSENANGLTR